MRALQEQTVESAQLNRRIVIQQPTCAQDALGGQVQTFTNVYTCWASIEIQASQLLYETAEFISETVRRITIRYTSSYVFNIGDQIVYTEPTTSLVHTYQIKAIDNAQQRNRTIMFVCYELNAQE